ncbi:VRR-NUC domain-containing protein [Pseudomonas psychrotolerans]|uniref:VRR-NUC domain-containing protein n=1 Tax=Pseudomonas oryzihabitans TaxID=47885 RepID=UPI0015E3168C|nr:VRR-NUC domain-containing protein [Pseudomonas psychrotolerans]MBA1179555.1 VRR-NUC domain-containing protein [Pseudomonas psychrotolerans]MBA1212158.1 VRR-NUC domain-containing protein [Pseudomonas psychrotolerans]
MSAVLKKYQPREVRARAPRIDWEGNEQTILFTWIDLQYPCESKLIYHVPNGGHRHKATAGKLKGQGVRAGMPDINVDIARGGYFGMRIEFKATPPNDSPISPKQRDALQLLNDGGYLAILCRGVHDAQEQIRAYLRLPATEARP